MVVNIKLKNKKGQITIFIIIALLILAVLAFVFYPNFKKFINPSVYDLLPESCIEKEVSENLKNVMLLGGELKPNLFFRYNNQTITYLCYTSEWYKTCVMQIPMLKQKIESEIINSAQKKVDICMANMKKSIETKGYEVKIEGTKELFVDISPDNKIRFGVDAELILNKEGDKKIIPASYLKYSINSNAYKMIMIASSIQNFEARFGDAVTENYMSFYPNMKVEKERFDDGTKVYIITDRDTKEVLQFATRSLAWPPGYAIPLMPTEI
jgi:hypothetical protein